MNCNAAYIQRVQRKRWLLIIPFVLSMMTLYLFDVYELMRPKAGILSQIGNLTVTGFLVHTPGCRIPDLDPFDEAVKKYYEKAPPYSCGGKRALIESNQTSIWIVREALYDYGAWNATDFTCCYKPFWRKEVDEGKHNEGADNDISISDGCIEFSDSADVRYEYVQVMCKMNGNVIYTDFHAFIVPKTPGGVRDPEPTEGISMLIIGTDAVSRLNFYRQMPKTREYLKSLKAIEFLGYNKVHDNTFPNLVPLFSGYSVDEIQKLCWFDQKTQFDRCPWIWKKLNEKNYLTGYGEDACWMGVFNYLKRGFLEAPTDYYLRPYMKMNEDEIGHSQEGNAKFCCGVRFCSQVLFDYALKFTTNLTLSEKKFWGFFWGGSLTHDFLNVPPNADDIYYNLLNNFKKSKALEKTVVFFMSDHGIRWGSIRETFQGRLEERLPFLYVLLPEWFKEKYSSAVANMRRNTRALTTHFDLHETMKDLMDLSLVEAESIRNRRTEWNKRGGISLFLPIPVNRTCNHAAIPDEWCTCHESKSVSVNDKLVIRAAEILVDHINNMLSGYTQCAHLSLKTIHSARIESSGEKIMGSTREQILDYVIVIKTLPGDAEFEATVRYRTESNRMTVQGFVSRINMYGSQSKCVLDYSLRLYCYCSLS